MSNGTQSATSAPAVAPSTVQWNVTKTSSQKTVFSEATFQQSFSKVFSGLVEIDKAREDTAKIDAIRTTIKTDFENLKKQLGQANAEDIKKYVSIMAKTLSGGDKSQIAAGSTLYKLLLSSIDVSHEAIAYEAAVNFLNANVTGNNLVPRWQTAFSGIGNANWFMPTLESGIRIVSLFHPGRWAWLAGESVVNGLLGDGNWLAPIQKMAKPLEFIPGIGESIKNIPLIGSGNNENQESSWVSTGVDGMRGLQVAGGPLKELIMKGGWKNPLAFIPALIAGAATVSNTGLGPIESRATTLAKGEVKAAIDAKLKTLAGNLYNVTSQIA